MYTKALYKKNSHELFRTGSFDAHRSKPGHVYKVKLSPQLALTDYDKKVFTVKVEDGGDFVTCDCGFFDHVGLLCCHSLKVCTHFFHYGPMSCVSNSFLQHRINDFSSDL